MSKISRPAPIYRSTITLLLSAVIWIALLNVSQQALAHHALGGSTPTDFFTGFLSGLAHPVIGLDHFAFVIAIGLVTARQAYGALIVAGFILTALAGTGIHLLSLDLPATEIAIATSVIVFGTILVLPNRPNTAILAVLATLAGLFHGYAYGEAIVGAQMSPLIAYLLGFSSIQYVVALVVQAIGHILYQRTAHKPLPIVRLVGLVICVLGGVFLTNSIGG